MNTRANTTSVNVTNTDQSFYALNSDGSIAYTKTMDLGNGLSHKIDFVLREKASSLPNQDGDMIPFNHLVNIPVSQQLTDNKTGALTRIDYTHTKDGDFINEYKLTANDTASKKESFADTEHPYDWSFLSEGVNVAINNDTVVYFDENGNQMTAITGIDPIAKNMFMQRKAETLQAA